jgi:alkylhydroperoxidase/carboxymuconolactone decarboxylase family protein YurZ
VSDQQPGMSEAFRAFMHKASGHARAWMGAVRDLDEASALDNKTEELTHLAVLAALRLESGVPLHVQLAKEAGASREEVISAILVGMPVAGQGVTQVLPTGKATYDAK